MKKLHYGLTLFILFLPLLMAASCGGDEDKLPKTPTLVISPKTQSVVVGGPALSFTATVENSSASVLWTLSGAGSLNVTKGSSVAYTPPSSLPAIPTVELTATLEGTSISNKATITLTTPPLAPKLYVNADTGSDTNSGTQDKPFKTITKALSVALAGQTVVPALGESRAFSTITRESFPLRLKSGVNLEAEGLVVIGGSGTCLQLENVDGVRITNIALQCDIGISVRLSSSVTITSVNVATSGTGTGIAVTNSQVALDKVQLLNSLTGLRALGSSQVTMTNSKLFGNQTGAELADESNFTADDSSFVENTSAGIFVLEGASVTVNNSFLDKNGNGSSAGYGLVLNSDRDSNITIDNSSFDGNSGSGVHLQAGFAASNFSDVTITNSIFSNNPYGLLVGNAEGVIELRKNKFAFNTLYQISDQRPARSTVPLFALETTIDDGMGEYQLSGVETGPDRDGNVWEIIGAANRICFSSCP